MTSPVLQKIDHGLRLMTPTLTAVLFSLMSVMVWPLPYLGPVIPALAFVALYYWTAHRPDLLPAGVAFGIGLLNDIVSGLPMGVSALLYTLARQLIVQQRRFFAGHSFITLWAGFALASGLLMLTQWLVIALLRWQTSPLTPVLLQTLLAIAIFPLPCWVLIRLQRAVLVTEYDRRNSRVGAMP